MANGDDSGNGNSHVTKQCKAGYKVFGMAAHSAEVKANRTDTGGNFYVYNLHDNNGKILAMNRYCYKNSEEQSFEEITEEEELILNPPIEEPKEVI